MSYDFTATTKLYRTGTTNQVQVRTAGFHKNSYYLPGVYDSHNLEDALPMETTFTLRTKKILFIGNDLTEVLHCWRAYCAEVEVLDVLAISRLG